MSSNVQQLMRKGKLELATFIKAECQSPHGPVHLNILLDYLLDASKSMDDDDRIDWCRYLISGGTPFDIFAKNVRCYDNSVICGLVWTTDFVAYRCRTCGLSPCMSLCADCFQASDHVGHDYNMFRSQAGGACDCGDISVMKPIGFCGRHGPENAHHVQHSDSLDELLGVARVMMPRLIYRLILHLREQYNKGMNETYTVSMPELESYLDFLHELSDMGAAMRAVISDVLLDRQLFIKYTSSAASNPLLSASQTKYESALRSLTPVPFPAQFKAALGLDLSLVHATLLDELLFWVLKYEFPQKIVTLLLSMLPIDHYKESFAVSFLHHYTYMSVSLVNVLDHTRMSNSIVHISVQLLSPRDLAMKLVTQHHLLHIIIASLDYMLENVLTEADPNCEGGPMVVDCSHHVMKDRSYWSLASDLINVFSQRDVALYMFNNEVLLELWLRVISKCQGMNTNQRELVEHVEYEPDSYYAAFGAELEICSATAWSLVGHLMDQTTRHHTLRILQLIIRSLDAWFSSAHLPFTRNAPVGSNPLQFSFHYPLHRYLAIFLRNGVRRQGVRVSEVFERHDRRLEQPAGASGSSSLILLEQPFVYRLITHPLQLFVSVAEISCGMWVRNGMQIRGQALTYAQSHFCNSTMDADLYLMQVISTLISPDVLLTTILRRFHVLDLLTFDPRQRSPRDPAVSRWAPGSRPFAPGQPFLNPEQEMNVLEHALVFISTLLSVRTFSGVSDDAVLRSEMVSLLCMSDRTHSQLLEHTPDKCNHTILPDNFEQTLKEVSKFKAPVFGVGGSLQQGKYQPTDEVWVNEFDPLHVLMRANYKREYGTAMERYTEHVKQRGLFKGSTNPWPPFRSPAPLDHACVNLLSLLHCRTMHGILFTLLHKAVNDPSLPESILYYTIYLLELSVTTPSINSNDTSHQLSSSKALSDWRSSRSGWSLDRLAGSGRYKDKSFSNWFATDSLAVNLCSRVREVSVGAPTSLAVEVYTQTDEKDKSHAVEVYTQTDHTASFSGSQPNTAAVQRYRNEWNAPVSNDTTVQLYTHTSTGMSLGDDDDEDDDDNTTSVPLPSLSSPPPSSYSSSSSSSSLLPTGGATSGSSHLSLISLRQPINITHLPSLPPSLPPPYPRLSLPPPPSHTPSEGSGSSVPSTTSSLVPAGRSITIKPRYSLPVAGHGVAGRVGCSVAARSSVPKQLARPAVCENVAVNESIISLLLKLHSKLSRPGHPRYRVKIDPAAQRSGLLPGQIHGQEQAHGQGQRERSQDQSRASGHGQRLKNVPAEELTNTQVSHLNEEEMDVEEERGKGKWVGHCGEREAVEGEREQGGTRDESDVRHTKYARFAPESGQAGHAGVAGQVSQAGNAGPAHQAGHADQGGHTGQACLAGQAGHGDQTGGSQDTAEYYPPEDEGGKAGGAEQDSRGCGGVESRDESRGGLGGGGVDTGGSVGGADVGIGVHWDESRVGDGAYFISNLLDKMCLLDGGSCVATINEVLAEMYGEEGKVGDNEAQRDGGGGGSEEGKAGGGSSAEESRRLAKKRQERLLKDFAAKQKQFMEKAMKADKEAARSSPRGSQRTGEAKVDDGVEEEVAPAADIVYDCCICNQSAATTEERPIGLVTLLQSTSVLGHRRRSKEPVFLPCSGTADSRSATEQRSVNYASEFNRRVELLKEMFEEEACLTAVNLGWEGGVYATTCGHYLHLDCHESYLRSLRAEAQAQIALRADKGEFLCPVCRQLSNTLLPLTPHPPSSLLPLSSLVLHSPSDVRRQVELIADILSSYSISESESALRKCMLRVMTDITNATYPQYCCLKTNDSPANKHLFSCSLLRVNLELELLQYKHSSPCSATSSSSSISAPHKKSCLSALVAVLGLHSKQFLQKPLTVLWSQITGVDIHSPTTRQSNLSICKYNEDVPLLLRDIQALFIQIFLSLPPTIDKTLYGCVVSSLYNVALIQAVACVTAKFSSNEIDAWRSEASPRSFSSLIGRSESLSCPLSSVIGQVIEHLSTGTIYGHGSGTRLPAICQTVWTLESVESTVVQHLISFLRLAAQLQRHLYDEPIPTTELQQDPSTEFTLLATYLNIHPATPSSSGDKMSVGGGEKNLRAAMCLRWAVDDPYALVRAWCLHLTQLANISDTTARMLLWTSSPVIWYRPRLITLPLSYDQIFRVYRKKSCAKCRTVPANPALCLICSQLVCYKDSCCNNSLHSGECTQHSVSCGGGTGMFLMVKSSVVVIVRGPRFVVWGSIYLDEYGEEDRDLKRGKPLLLNEERYCVLRRLWITHDFDHACKLWSLHLNQL